MTKEVWITTVTAPDQDHPVTEYRFSELTPEQYGHSRCYYSYSDLSEGLKKHSGHIIHWAGTLKTYKVRVDVREEREVYGTIIVHATDEKSAISAALCGSFDDFVEDGCEYGGWKIVDAKDPEEQ